MADDYQEGVCPPQWCWDRVNELGGHRKAYWGPSNWHPGGSAGSAFAAYIWQHENPPVDPMLEHVQEAIALYEEEKGYPWRTAAVRDGDYGKGVTAAVTYLRKQGRLK